MKFPFFRSAASESLGRIYDSGAKYALTANKAQPDAVTALKEAADRITDGLSGANIPTRVHYTTEGNKVYALVHPNRIDLAYPDSMSPENLKLPERQYSVGFFRSMDSQRLPGQPGGRFNYLEGGAIPVAQPTHKLNG